APASGNADHGDVQALVGGRFLLQGVQRTADPEAGGAGGAGLQQATTCQARHGRSPLVRVHRNDASILRNRGQSKPARGRVYPPAPGRSITTARPGSKEKTATAWCGGRARLRTASRNSISTSSSAAPPSDVGPHHSTRRGQPSASSVRRQEVGSAVGHGPSF